MRLGTSGGRRCGHQVGRRHSVLCFSPHDACTAVRAAGTTWCGTLPAARGSSQLAAIAESFTGTKIKNFFIVVLIPILKFPDKLIGKGCPTTGVPGTEYVERKTADSIAAPRRNFEADSAAPSQRAPPLDHVQVAAVRAAWHQWWPSLRAPGGETPLRAMLLTT